MGFLLNYLNTNFNECDSLDFYRDLFPIGSFQEKGVFEKGKYNGLIVEIDKNIKSDGKRGDKFKILKHLVTDDLDKITKVCSRDNFCIISPISYIGKSRKSKNARIIYALAIDLDGLKVTEKNNIYGISTLFHQIHNLNRIPNPTYVVFSGTGLHLYYVFEKPIRLFPNVVNDLQKYKRELTRIIWQDDITDLSYNVQYESLFQGFRIVGSKTKLGDLTRAFSTGEKVSIDYLNQFVEKKFKIEEIAYISKQSLKEAKEKYPDWYKKRILKKQPKATWTTKRDLYDWWKNRIINEARTGHRYYCLMCLAIYAKKAGISFEELEKDATKIGKKLSKLPCSPDNPFTNRDVLDALKAYDDSYITYPVNSISHVSGIHIERNKRNYRSQKLHLRGARAIKEILKEVGEMKPEGRPKGSGTKEKLVKDFLNEHKDKNLSITEIAKRLNVSRTTVYKYLR